jgi:hypothetical protein
MTEQQVWTSEPCPIDAYYRIDGVGILPMRAGQELSSGFQRSAPIPSAEELAAMREVCDAARDAATSLETIAKLAGRDEFMIDVEDTRGYAANRAKVAREALSRLDATRAAKGASDAS